MNLGAGPIEPASSPFSPLNVNSYTDPNLKTGYSDQWNFGFQQELAPGATATVNYVGSRNANIATVSRPTPRQRLDRAILKIARRSPTFFP